MTQETYTSSRPCDPSTTPASPCNCRKTSCQQMYCECLARGRLCNEACRCEDCKNTSPNPKLERVIQNIQKQAYNKEATQRVRFRSDRFNGGCTCKRSKCIKKYCECYQNRRRCDRGCKCVGCLNKESSGVCSKRVKTSKFELKEKGQRLEFSL